ncbi:MAG: TlpA family protein disulfide reductase [Bacteroidetes bacterium]|nr:TlpA family protein disulfide reductase [Bacteroidota bacterium]
MKVKLLRGIILFSAFSLILAMKAIGQEARIIKWVELDQLMQSKNDTTYIINFWATWCAPCVKELPHFEKLAAENKNRKVKVILVSLDFKRQFEMRLIPFITENKILSEILLLDEPDYNQWIDKVDPSWNGSIPATLILDNKNKKRNFYEREFTYEELLKIVNPYLN